MPNDSDTHSIPPSDTQLEQLVRFLPRPGGRLPGENPVDAHEWRGARWQPCQKREDDRSGGVPAVTLTQGCQTGHGKEGKEKHPLFHQRLRHQAGFGSNSGSHSKWLSLRVEVGALSFTR